VSEDRFEVGGLMTRICFQRKPANWVRLILVSLLLVMPLVVLAPRASAKGVSTILLSGLSVPAETATSSQGDVFFTQLVSSGQVDIFRLAQGSRSPVDLFQLVGFQPYINDIHIDSSGNVIFISSVATTFDGSVRRWDLTRLDPSTGVASVLVSTYASPSDLVPPFHCIGSGCGLIFGTEIDLAGVDSAGTIYFSEHTIDPVSGNQTANLLELQPGDSSPIVVAHFAGVSGSDGIGNLNVARSGGVSFQENESLYEYSKSGLRVLIPATGPWGATGVDAAENLYVLEVSRVGATGFGCAVSSTESILEFTARSLLSANPVAKVVSQATYSGFVATWVGSSSFFRVSNQGNAFWSQTSITCSSSGFRFSSNEVVAFTHSEGQSILYQENVSTPSSDFSPAAQGPIGIATFGAFVYVATIESGNLIRFD
jgi:hypothetical protein